MITLTKEQYDTLLSNLDTLPINEYDNDGDIRENILDYLSFQVVVFDEYSVDETNELVSELQLLHLTDEQILTMSDNNLTVEQIKHLLKNLIDDK